MARALIEARRLNKTFPMPAGPVVAVRDVTLVPAPG